ncbi:MAG: hypothetical protein NT103_09865 [Campylobacterales bacterium]|nr:hypothetical protein [Campylobacterales bacterium]
MKRIIIFFVLSVTGWCASYDPFLLDTQLTLLPKIAMLNKNIALPHSKSPIKILIAYESDDEDTALICSKILINKFNRTLNGHPIVVTILPFDKLDSSTSYHLIYALKASLSQLKKVHNTVGSSSTITALYDADKLTDAGILLSIRMERVPVILINAKALRENKISFPDSLLEIARII